MFETITSKIGAFLLAWPPGGFLVQRSIPGRAAEMGLKISLLV